MIPVGAQKIIDVRTKGFKPDEMILVSFIGRINELNYTVYAMPGRDYDWFWIKGLQVCIYASSGVDWIEAALAMTMAKPSYLGLWDVGRSQGAELWTLPAVADIDKPPSQWRWLINYMPWTPAQNWRFAECN